MCYRKTIVIAAMTLLISVANLGNLFAAHGGMGGGFGGGMGGFHGAMGGSFHSGMSGAFHSFAMPSFSGGARNFSYSTQHFSAAPRINGNFVSHIPSNSFNSGFRGQQFGFQNNRNFQSTIRNPVNPQAWSRNNNWWRNNFAWNRGYYHDHDFGHFNRFAFFPYWFPAWWDYGPFYSWYGNPYYSYYDNGYSPYDYYYNYEPGGYYSEAPAVESGSYPVNEQYPAGSEEAAATSSDWGNQFLTSARDAFRNGDYSDALRLASHAAVELPKDAKVHELMSLALFANKDYKGANIEAHEALSLGPASDWSTLYGYYEDLPAYSKQLDALVDYIRDHKDAMDARFVLAYQDIMMGHKDAAKIQLEDIVAKIPKDQVAVQLLKNLGGTVSSEVEKSPQGASTVERSAAIGEKKQY